MVVEVDESTAEVTDSIVEELCVRVTSDDTLADEALSEVDAELTGALGVAVGAEGSEDGA